MNNKYFIYNAEAIQTLQKLNQAGIKVDMILTDPPYELINPQWDKIIPIPEMWRQLKGISKKRTPTLLFCNEPFTSQLILENLNNFRYKYIWDKHGVTNPFITRYGPSSNYEEITVFYKQQPTYNPQRVPRYYGDQTRKSECDKKQRTCKNGTLSSHNVQRYYIDDGTRHPTRIIKHISSQQEECVNNKRYHPTQKPVALLEWLIKTYTNPNDLVLDFTMGSGSTGVACMKTGRNFIGIELNKQYFTISRNRIEQTLESVKDNNA